MPVTFDLDKSSAMGTTTKFTENQVAADDISTPGSALARSRVIYDPRSFKDCLPNLSTVEFFLLYIYTYAYNI